MPRSRAKIDIEPLGDSALIVRVRDNAAALEAQRKIVSAKITGLIECAPAYESVGVFYEPSAIESFDEFVSQIQSTLTHRARGARVESQLVGVPAQFDLEFALDLEQVARHAQLSPNEVVDLYCSVEYRVACIGFTPGFPYLIGLPEKLITPRRATPRKEIPAGSIAIGGHQTGIYPIASPGGWNVIGRTSLRLFDANNDPPVLLRAGDRVRFVRSTS
ncbi:MAG: inhibitor of KinA [Verrucomicrobiota bacterium]|jgi:inhibitor of KinA